MPHEGNEKNKLVLMGKKLGMLQVFNKERATAIGCTAIEIEPNVITQLKTKDVDGYSAIQVGAFKVKSDRKKCVKKPLLGHFSKNKVAYRTHMCESRLDSNEGFELGQELGADQFEGGFVDVTATSKGKGYQGVMKRHGAKGGPAAHGSGFHRHVGSRGNRSFPGRTFKMTIDPGHMGSETKTVQCLRVVRVLADKGVILVEGPVPGYKGCVVKVKKSVKKTK
jgi:large subunit ribosomal protein L3